MNKYYLYVIGWQFAHVCADYFDVADGSFYFYKNGKVGGSGNILVGVYPINRTAIREIDYNYFEIEDNCSEK